MNLSDDESRIMPVSGGGFEQCYNAQAGVDTETMLVVSTHMTQATNDKQQITPALTQIGALPQALGTVTDLLADTGYFSKTNVQACRENNIQPSLAVARDQHHLSVFDRFAADEPAPVTNDPVVQMKHRLTTQSGRALYALRKQTVEPVFGIQAGDGPEAVLDEGAEEGCRRMDVSHAGMERKAYERVENGGVRAFCRHFKAFHGVL